MNPKDSKASPFLCLRILLVSSFLSAVGCVRLATYDPWDRPSQLGTPSDPIFPKEAATRRIRVAIAVRKQAVTVEAPGAFVLSGDPLPADPGSFEGGRRYRELHLTSDKLIRSKAFLAPLGDGEIRVDGKSYRGSLEVLGDLKATVTVINELPLEEYVMGVLAGEIPQGWPLEALKAQALAARTFAVLNQAGAQKRGSPYDLENTHLYQMYSGTEKVTPMVRQAVVETAGEVILHGGEFIQAFFHSNCGGRTSRAGSVWSKDRPYLVSVDCPSCSGGPHYRWTRELSLAEVARSVRAAGVPVAEVFDLKVEERDESGRALWVSFRDEGGVRRRMKGAAFRMALGSDVVKSTKFDLGTKEGKLLFSGRGWGHGVGLCQEGAFGMAAKGHKAGEIIRRYYRSITIERMRGG